MKTYNDYVGHLQKIARLNASSALLQWDQEVYMPVNGAKLRAEQLALLATMVHGLSTSEEYGNYLKSNLNNVDLSDTEKKNIERSYEDFEKQRRIPSSLVERISSAQSKAFQAWIEARQANDFSVYKPFLENIINLTKEYAAHLGTSDDPYGTLLDLYDTGIKLEQVDKIFDSLIPGIHRILDNLDSEYFSEDLPAGIFKSDKQMEFGSEICESLGFNFNAGRQDLSEHPFTIGIHPTDVRITTRIDENSLAYMLWSTIHECGHALYEQGLPVEQFGLPLGEAASLSIHESQSRLYENNLGRSRVFINSWFPRMKEVFPDALQDYDQERYFRSVNKIAANLIRTEADELHYHLHIYIRYQIEKELMHEKIKVSEARDRWNSLYKEHLGIEVPDDKSGILQDVHWSHGSIGYFPTYTLGSLYASQFMDSAFAQMSNLQKSLEEGSYADLHSWLRENIHNHGRYYTSDELSIKVTGKSLSTDSFISYCEDKYLGL